MASYSNINGIKSITTGDEAGTWGTSTNTNLDILDAASRGYKKITMADSDLTLPMDNNPTAVENGHYFGIEFFGANSASRTITIEQNDHSLVYAFLNNTGQDLVIQQGDGSGGTVTIGDTNGAIVFCDGAGTGAKVTNLSSTLNTSSADQLTNAREFSIIGDITAAAVSFNGTANVALSAAITAGSIVNADINASAAIEDTKLATISTAGKVANSATTATDANTASAIVTRDGSGNFAAGTITAALTGDVKATNGTTVLDSGTDGTDATFTGAVTGNVSGTAGSLASAQNFSITGDVTAAAVSFDGTGAVALSSSISNLADTKLATISTTGKVSNSATTATDANTASAIVARDESGNFSAGTVTASLAGDVYASDGTSKILESGTDGTDATFTGAVTGSVSGNAGTATALASGQNFSITGDVTAAAVSFDGTGAVALSAAITAGSIVNADINSSAAIADTKLDTISTSGKVSNSATTATDSNTANAIVARDGSGNFSAGTITAALSGNATTATTLETARTIAGQSFNGSANISIGPTDLTGVTASASDINTASTNYVPSGGIIMWSGAIAAIPTGWVLCDGNNSTPDLRDRFIVGAGSTYAVDATGGSSTVTLTEANLPSHTHGAGTLATASAGSHTHTTSATFRESAGIGDTAYQNKTVYSEGLSSEITINSAGAHTHTISGSTGSTGSGTAHENRPPYYALAYIMKT
jgi:microcystin-dependent protein